MIDEREDIQVEDVVSLMSANVDERGGTSSAQAPQVNNDETSEEKVGTAREEGS